MKLEQTILNLLVNDEEYCRKVIPFLQPEYFGDYNENLIFNEIKSFLDKYNSTPTVKALGLSVSEKTFASQEQMNECLFIVKEFLKKESINPEWMIQKTEKFCQDRAIYLAVKESIQILDGKAKDTDKGAIPDLLSKALAVSFDHSVGHDYLEDSNDRYEFYHRIEERIPFDIELLNQITQGGLPKKTLNVIMGGTAGGKTLMMCHMAAHHFTIGKNVLYITCEMAEERISERIDANLLDVSIDDLQKMSKDVYDKKINRIRSMSPGKLIVREFPTSTASVSHFRNLINELKLKKNFVPDIIYVDYLNICISSRLKMTNNINGYAYVKAITEEMRGFAVENNVPVVTATQLNRTGFGSSDPDLTDTSESFGTPMTADFMVVLVSSEEMDELNQIMIKQLKNRYGGIDKFRRFAVGIDRSKMRLYNLEKVAQRDIADANIQEIVKSSKPNFERATPKPGAGLDFDGWKL